MKDRMCRKGQRELAWVAVILIPLSLTVAGFGQAWVPPKGEGELSLSFQDLVTTEHFNGDGTRHDYGHIGLVGLVHSVDYGITDRLAVAISVPFGAGKYNGPFPHQLPIDDGNYHGTIQDLRFGVRYNIRTHPLVLTPLLVVAFPSHHYEHFAHSAVGTDLWEVQMGINLGRRLDPVLPNAYFQTRYSFAIMQQVLGIRPNRSRVDSEIGYFLTPRLAVRALASSQITHSGLDFPQDFPSTSPTNQRWLHHDQISTINFLNLGAGGSMAVTKSLDVFGAVLHSVWGQNGHALKYGVTIGVSWSFRTRRAAPQFASDDGPLTQVAWRSKPTQINPCH